MQTKVHFFKSYYKMGWWAARLPKSGDWSNHSVEVLGFGVTTNQAERDLLSKEQSAGAEELAA
ncbi:MAG: hypothetical protein R2748_00930 [Bryobacterales bacterium]